MDLIENLNHYTAIYGYIPENRKQERNQKNAFMKLNKSVLSKNYEIGRLKILRRPTNTEIGQNIRDTQQ